MRYMYRIDPEELEIEDWAKLSQESLYIIKLQQQIIWGDNKE